MAFFYDELPRPAGARPRNPLFPVEISAGTVHETCIKYTIPTGTAAGAVVELVPLPPRARVVDVVAGALGSAATFAVGDGVDPARYITSAAVAAGAVTRMNAATGFGFSYVAGDTVDIVFAPGPAAAPTAGGVVFLHVRYVYE